MADQPKRGRRAPDLVIELRVHIQQKEPTQPRAAIALEQDPWAPLVRAVLEKAQAAGAKVTMPELIEAVGAIADHPTWFRLGEIVAALGWTRRRYGARTSRKWYYEPPSRARDERAHARAGNGVDGCDSH